MSVVRDPDTRRRELAAIHIAKKDLGMDDDTYRDMLFAIARVRSAGDLDQGGRTAVIEHLRKSGFKRKEQRAGAFNAGAAAVREGKPAFSAECRALGAKLEAQVAAGALSWKYAAAIAKRMFHVERLEWCRPEQLRSIVAALEYAARRKARR